jgi:hypothetical protein
MNRLIFFFVVLLVTKLSAQYKFTQGTLPITASNGSSMDIRFADIDKNGTLDIILAKEFQRNRILLGNGKGVFTDATATMLPNVMRDSEDIAIADLDGNGWLDIVFASEDDATHEMYLNNVNGSFTNVSSRLPNCVANAVVTWDVDGDNDIDIYLGCVGQDRLLINDGNANFTDETAKRLPADATITQDILLIDIEGDGDMDIVAGNEDENKLYVNTGNGFFTDGTTERLQKLNVNIETRKVIKADVDSDGDDDLFFCNMASKQGRDIRDRLYVNDGKGYFTDATDERLPYEFLNTFDAVFEDLNGDGAIDLLVSYLPNEIPGVYINNGKGKFSEDSSSVYLPPSSTGNNISIAMADLNGDGKKDIYIGCFQQQDKIFFAGDGVTSVGEENSNCQNSLRAWYKDGAITIQNGSADCATYTTFTLMSVIGQHIHTISVDPSNESFMPISDISSGVYLLIASGNGVPTSVIPVLVE